MDSHSSPLPFFVHIHIPKTGGTAFNSVLGRNFADRFERFQGRWINQFPKLNASQVRRFAERHEGIVATASHRITMDLPFQDCARPIIPISLIRNPVERFISLYFFLRQKPYVRNPEKEMSLDEYIEFKAAAHRNGQINSHLSFLMDSDNEENFEFVRDLVERGDAYLFPSKRIADGLCRLQSDFPEFFRDIRLDVENATRRGQDVTQDQKDRISEICSPYCWKLLDLAERQTQGGLTPR